jgi:hypothetical protein
VGRTRAYLSRIIRKRIVIPLLAIAACALFPAAGAASPHAGGTAPKHKFGRGTSTNWSGYAAGGSGASHVIGSWTQPPASCSPAENSWSSPWVGIDGDSSNTVEQIGTDTDCSNGVPSYYAWYEMYPKPLVVINIPVSPGNSFTGEVTYLPSSRAFALKLTNTSTGNTFQTTQGSKKARRTSVEWVMEGPSSGLLTNFGTVGFTAASATIGNQTGNLGSFSNAQPITMVTQQGTQRAVPSAVSGGGTSFDVRWQHG